MNTNTLENFQVMRDNELDTEYARKQRVEAAVGHLAHVGNTITTLASNALKQAFTPFILDVTDMRNGSHLREQYFANKRQAETAAIAEAVGLEVE